MFEPSVKTFDISLSEWKNKGRVTAKTVQSIRSKVSEGGLLPNGMSKTSCFITPYHKRPVMKRTANQSRIWRNCWVSWKIMLLFSIMVNFPKLFCLTFYVYLKSQQNRDLVDSFRTNQIHIRYVILQR